MNDDELFIISPLDQPIPADTNEFLSRVETVIEDAVRQRDPIKALKVCREMVQAQKISGLVLAKALFMIRQHWKEFAKNGDDFVDVVYEYVGLHRHTVERYLAVWGMFHGDYVPKDLEEQIKQRNIKDLIPIANAINQGYEIERSQWEAIGQAPDFLSVSKIIREEVKNSDPRTGTMVLSLDGIGNIWCYFDNDRYFIGTLELDASDNPVIEKAINRIVQNAGILRG